MTCQAALRPHAIRAFAPGHWHESESQFRRLQVTGARQHSMGILDVGQADASCLRARQGHIGELHVGNFEPQELASKGACATLFRHAKLVATMALAQKSDLQQSTPSLRRSPTQHGHLQRLGRRIRITAVSFAKLHPKELANTAWAFAAIDQLHALQITASKGMQSSARRRHLHILVTSHSRLCDRPARRMLWVQYWHWMQCSAGLFDACFFQYSSVAARKGSRRCSREYQCN